MSRKTTLSQIAEAAGVSLSTVDRVLNGRGGVKPDAEARVIEWAQKLDLDRRLATAHVRQVRIAVLMQAPTNPFYRGLQDAFSAMNTTFADMRLACFQHHADVTNSKLLRGKVKEIGANYDALIVVSPDDPALSDALFRLSERLPIVTLATDLPKSGRFAYVGPDNRQTGRAAGELMGRFLGERGGDIVIVVGLNRMIGHEEREMGFRSVLRARFPQCRIIATVESGENAERAGDEVRGILKRHRSVSGIYNVSSGNRAIASAIEACKLSYRPAFITHELTPERRQLLLDGTLDAVIDQNPRLEAETALWAIARHFKRGLENDASARPTFTPFNIFIRENCPVL